MWEDLGNQKGMAQSQQDGYNHWGGTGTPNGAGMGEVPSVRTTLQERSSGNEYPELPLSSSPPSPTKASVGQTQQEASGQGAHQ